MRARLAVRGWTLIVLAAACSGGPSPNPAALTPGERVEVVYADGTNRLGLRNMSSVDQTSYQEHGLYGGGAGDAKLADDGTMAALLEALTELGHFQRGAATARADAKVNLSVTRGGKTTVWSRPALLADNMPELEKFNTARAAFLHVHTNIVSYHASRMTGEEMQRNLQEQEQRNREAVQNILRKARDG